MSGTTPRGEATDPGWRPALRAASRLVTSGPSGSMLVVMRATVVLLCTVAGATALLALLLGAGSGEPKIDGVAAHVVLGAGVAAAAAVMALTGRVLPEEGPGEVAAFLFVTTQRKVLAAACVGPLGLFLSWLAADGAQVIFGVGAAVLLMAVAAPTADRIHAWQEEVDTFPEPFSVLEALLAGHR
jgi:hypothetical protein